MRLLAFFASLLLLISCAPHTELSADIVILNANIYIYNDTSKEKITQALLAEEADVYLLFEAVLGHNVDSALFVDAGYEVAQTLDTVTSSNSVVATRVGGSFSVGNLEHTTETFSPVITLRIPYGVAWLSIVGVHAPAPYYADQEVRDRFFDALRPYGESGLVSKSLGVAEEGDFLVLAGDFNAFPTDDNMQTLTMMGLADGALVAAHPYGYTWSPHWWATDFARIDYLFASPEVDLSYQTTCEIAGSDHRAVKTGVMLP